MSAPKGGALPADDELLTTREAAAALRLGTSTLERMRGDGSGPPFIKLGRGKTRCRVVYARSALNAWLTEQRFQSTSEYHVKNGGRP